MAMNMIMNTANKTGKVMIPAKACPLLVLELHILSCFSSSFNFTSAQIPRIMPVIPEIHAITPKGKMTTELRKKVPTYEMMHVQALILAQIEAAFAKGDE